MEFDPREGRNSVLPSRRKGLAYPRHIALSQLNSFLTATSHSLVSKFYLGWLTPASRTPTDVAEAWVVGLQDCAENIIDHAMSTATAAPAAR